MCTVEIKSNSLLSCLSISTMCLLIFTSIIIITIISITPIIILGLGEISAGQRDLILTHNSNGYLNTTKITQLSGQVAMPRISSLILVGSNAKQQGGVGWFMDLNLEAENHLGTLPLNHNLPADQEPVYLHTQFGIKEGEQISIELADLSIFTSFSKHLS